jgi:DNA invertase Pin-like site-specific DNA recombinase
MGRSGETFISPELQQHAIGTRARADGYYIVKWIPDIDKGGRSFTRRRVGEVVEDVRVGTYQRLYINYWSRWGRNAKESLIYLALVEEKAGGEVVSVTEPFDRKTAFGRFTRAQALILAELQSDLIGEGWKAVHQNRRDRGLPHAGRQARFGYVHETRTTLDKRGDAVTRTGYWVDENLRELYADLYDRYIAGTSMRRLVVDLNAQGVLTTTGRRWSDATLPKVLDSGFAAGYIRENSDPGRDDEGGFKPPAGGLSHYNIWRRGAHEAIISERTWQDYKARRGEQADTAPRSRVPAHSFSGLVRCGLDGGPWVSNHGGGPERALYWRCRMGRDQGLHPPMSIRDDVLKPIVRDWILSHARGDSASVTQEAEQLQGRRQATGDIAQHRRALGELTARKTNLLGSVEKGLFSDEEIRERKREIEAETAAVQRLIAQAELAEQASGGHLIRQFESLAEEWDRHVREPELHRMALGAVIAKVVVFGEGRVEIVPVWELASWDAAWVAANGPLPPPRGDSRSLISRAHTAA